MVKNVGGDVLVNVFEGQSLIRRPRVRGTGTHITTAINISDRDSDDDEIEIEQLNPPANNTRAAYSVNDMIEDFNDIENYMEDIDNITDVEDTDSETVEHNGNVLYRIRSVTPDAVPVPTAHGVEPLEHYGEEYMYKLDRLDHEQRRQEARDIRPLPQRSTWNPGPALPYVQVRQHHIQAKSLVKVGMVKRRREEDDEPQHRQEKRKVVRIQLPPVEEPVQDRRREEVARMQQLRNMPALEPRRPHIPSLVFPPPSQLPTARREGVSTEAFYKAMRGPPPSGRPLESRARPSNSAIPQPGQQVAASRRQAKPRIPAHFDSDGADDLSTGPNPSIRFDGQRELRDGQAGPSNERFIPKGQGNGKRRD